MNYKLKNDTVCWMVVEVKVAGEKAAKPGGTYEKPVSFHANLEQAALSLMQRLLREGCEADQALPTILKAVKNATNEVKKAVAEAVP